MRAACRPWLATLARSLMLAALAGASQASGLPTEVRQALQRAGVPASALSVVIEPAGEGPPRLSQHPERAVNPASLTKLVTTYMALERLGPAWSWSTPVSATGPVRDGVLEGDLVIAGRGDPTLVIERLWQGLLALRQSGIETVRGDIVLDRRAFEPVVASPADFDGDPTRPYNVLPDALLLNYHAALWTFEPDPASGRARVVRDVDLPGRTDQAATARTKTGVPLATGPCGDWRTALRLEPAGPDWRLRGRYPAACGVQTWPLAAPDPQAFGHDLVDRLWHAVGGRLEGRVRSLSAGHDGGTPRAAAPRLAWRSPPLALVVRDINKFSNNVMAEQLFLTLGVEPASEAGEPSAPATDPPATATPRRAQAALRQWVVQRLGEPAPGEFLIVNGSGLSRENRLSARWLAHMLQHAWASPVMPEFLASLPVSGVDGTMRRSRATPGRAHLKTGSLRDAIGRAGYVLDDQGRRHVFVALIEHPHAQAARPALDALVDWSMRASPVPKPPPEPSRRRTPADPASRAPQ